MDIDLPEVVAEVRAAFDRYEHALVTNDLATLNSIFHDAPQTIRYGIAENLYGHDEIGGFRAARSPVGLARRLSRTVITTFGNFHRACPFGRGSGLVTSSPAPASRCSSIAFTKAGVS